MTYKKQIEKILPEILNTDVLITNGKKLNYEEWCQLGSELGFKHTRRKWYKLIMERQYGFYQTWAHKALNQLLDELEVA